MTLPNKGIHFITWPDGRVDGSSLTAESETHAMRLCIQQWLPEQYFGGSKWLTDHLVRGIWRDMTERGFKVHAVELAKDGSPKLLER